MARSSGLLHAFKAIAENAGGGPAVVANGIAEALITTALGLFVAIPAVVAYNAFTNKIGRISEDVELCAEEIIDLPGVRCRPNFSRAKASADAPIVDINMVPVD